MAQLQHEAMQRKLMINELRIDVDQVSTALRVERRINENLYGIQLSLERELD